MIRRRLMTPAALGLFCASSHESSHADGGPRGRGGDRA